MIDFDSSEISNWADKPEAQHQLPKLVRRLISTTITKVSLLHMPSGSSVYLPGWDGLLEVDSGNAWVPDRASAWEFSSEKGPKSKATADYDKRTADPKGVNVSDATFMFVTPRKWKGKFDWARGQSEDGE